MFKIRKDVTPTASRLNSFYLFNSIKVFVVTTYGFNGTTKHHRYVDCIARGEAMKRPLVISSSRIFQSATGPPILFRLCKDFSERSLDEMTVRVGWISKLTGCIIKIKYIDIAFYLDNINLMDKYFNRILDIKLIKGKSAFLWGPRKSGKTSYVSKRFEGAIIIDLLKTEVFSEYATKPSLLRERYQNTSKIIIIDEIQMVPDLLNEVHWMIENCKISFILTGSSARKLKAKNVNMLGGRAWRYTMMPLTYQEAHFMDLEDVFIRGLLPSHYLSPDPTMELRSYVSDYLKEEISHEARVRNIPSFSEFLKVASLTSSELLNYTNVGRESGVKTRTVKEYFQILEDTLIGIRVEPWRKSQNRRMIETSKFYLFDVGISNYLTGRKPKIGTYEFGKSFEQYILMELMAYKAYKNPELPIYFWRTSSGYEVDFLIGEADIAIEIKGSMRVHSGDFRSLLALNEEIKVKHNLIVSLENEPRIIKELNINILPWRVFLDKLWNGEFGI